MFFVYVKQDKVIAPKRYKNVHKVEQSDTLQNVTLIILSKQIITKSHKLHKIFEDWEIGTSDNK